MGTHRDCPECGGRELHVGDRIAFVGDMARNRRFILGRWGRDAGLQMLGELTGDVDCAVTTCVDDTASVSMTDARALGIPLIADDDFERLLGTVCPGSCAFAWHQHAVVLRGKKVMVVGSRTTDQAMAQGPVSLELEVRELEDLLVAKGIVLGHQLRPSLAAVIVPQQLEGSGTALLAAQRVSVVYRASDFRRIYGG